MNTLLKLRAHTVIRGVRFHRITRATLCCLLSLILASTVSVAAAQSIEKDKPAQAPGAFWQSIRAQKPGASWQSIGSQKIVRQGVAIEFAIRPVAPEMGNQSELKEWDDAAVQLTITDAATNNPMTGLRPTAWINARTSKKTEADKCKEKVQSFLRGNLRTRPTTDLNSFFVLAMNKQSDISVINPLIGFGSSKLLAMIFMKSPGEDWALSSNSKTLLVTTPASNQVVVIDTVSWRLMSKINVGTKPMKIAFQPDQKYVWVGNDGDGTVMAIDATELKVAARIPTGVGHHEMAFTPDSRYAFVTNETDGELSVIDVGKLTKIKSVKTGKTATSLAFSPLSGAVYVADEALGTIAVIDSQSHQVRASIAAKPGIRAMKFTPDGRWGFVVNPKEDCVYIFDGSNNSLVQTVRVEPGPDQISFTKSYAYIRSAGSEQVSMIPLTGLDKDEGASVTKFPGGQIPAGKVSGAEAAAAAIVPAPESGSVLVANPGDQMIYYYNEGMAAPMGSLQNFRRQPKAVMVVDRSFRETAPGVYSAITKLPPAGAYDLVFFLDSPRVIHCFDFAVMPDPALAQKRDTASQLRVQFLAREKIIRPGEMVKVRFKLTDRATGEPKTSLKDVGFLAFLSPGVWQYRQWAAPVGEGVYEASFVPPEHGVYYIFLQCPSLKIKLNQLPHIVLDGREQEAVPAAKPADSAKGNQL